MWTIWNAACTYFSRPALVGKRVLNWGFCEHLRVQYETTIWFLSRTTTISKAGHQVEWLLQCSKTLWTDLPTTHKCYAAIKQDNSIVHLVTGNVPCTYQLNCTVGLLYSVSLMPRPHVGWSQDMRLVQAMHLSSSVYMYTTCRSRVCSWCSVCFCATSSTQSRWYETGSRHSRLWQLAND